MLNVQQKTLFPSLENTLHKAYTFVLSWIFGNTELEKKEIYDMLYCFLKSTHMIYCTLLISILMIASHLYKLEGETMANYTKGTLKPISWSFTDNTIGKMKQKNRQTENLTEQLWFIFGAPEGWADSALRVALVKCWYKPINKYNAVFYIRKKETD